MEISREQVLALAKLARLSLSEDEVSATQRDLIEILDYVDQLKALDVEDEAPMLHPLGMTMTLRADEPEQWLTHEQIMSNAPAQAQGQFKLPRVVGEGGEA